MYQPDARMRRDINQYLRGMEEKNLGKEYIRESRAILLKFQDHCAGFGIGATSRVSLEEVRDFTDKFQSNSGAYRRFIWAVLRTFLAEMDNATALKFKLRISGYCRERVDWLSPDQSENVLATPMTTREAVQIRAGLLQGLRRIEVVRMTVKDASSALLSHILVIRGKGGRSRSIPLHPGFAQALEAYLRDRSFDSNTPLLGIGANQASVAVVNFSVRFGRRFTSHTLRRSFGRNLWLKGVDVLTISELVGHSTVDMTRRYLGLNISDMKNALAKYTTTCELRIIDEVPRRRIAPERATDEPAEEILPPVSQGTCTENPPPEGPGTTDEAPMCGSSDIRNSVSNLINETRIWHTHK